MFLLFTPAHNERDNVEGLVRCVRESRLRPDRWVVIDDRSTDGTGQAFLDAAGDLPIEVVPSGTRGGYMGFRIAEVLQAGQRAAGDLDGVDYIGILDADIRVGPDYFARLAAVLDVAPGIASGALCSEDQGQWRVEPGQRVDLPRGGLRLVSGEVFRAVGGFARSRAWDSVMTVQARLRGYRVQLLPELLAASVRPTDSREADESGWASRGRRAWNLGQPGWQVLVRAAGITAGGRATEARALLRGYLDERGGERIADADVRAYYREQRPREWWASVKGRLGRPNPHRYLAARRVADAELEGAL
ncbi:MAG: glycosyltransferase [Deltaproteobacteria bacterium]|nr:MAG: glycosyltransferase [Deltaproteobacteria bacterium]